MPTATTARCLACLFGLVLAPLNTRGADSLSRVFKPVPHEGAVSAIDVRLTLNPDTEPTPAAYSIPLHVPGIKHLADAVSDARMTDDSGSLPLTVSTDETANLRHWTLQRPAAATVVLS